VNSDPVKRRVNQATGEVKEEAVKAMDDRTMSTKGKAEQAGAKARSAQGDIKNDIKVDIKGRTGTSSWRPWNGRPWRSTSPGPLLLPGCAVSCARFSCSGLR
jgi:uncharacterized protein YjbJ (UPF0337 family)